MSLEHEVHKHRAWRGDLELEDLRLRTEIGTSSEGVRSPEWSEEGGVWVSDFIGFGTRGICRTKSRL